MTTYWIRDPFAGWIEADGDTIEDAIESAYESVPECERPTHVWSESGEQISVAGGCCRPIC
jgi:hypothetical protein